MKPAAFAYERPRTVAEALTALAQPGAKVIAGGQSLVPLMNFRLSRPARLVDINHLHDMNGVSKREGRLIVGALTRHHVLASDPLIGTELPVLQRAAQHIGHWAIRNRGTIGGSVVHADPAAELPAALVALNASVVVQSSDGERVIPAEEFFHGFFTTALADHELVMRIEFPLKARRMGFAEVVRRPGDFALVGAYVDVAERGGAVTWFGLGARPERQGVSDWADNSSARGTVLDDLARQHGVDAQDEYKYAVAVTVAERAYQDALREG